MSSNDTATVIRISGRKMSGVKASTPIPPAVRASEVRIQGSVSLLNVGISATG